MHRDYGLQRLQSRTTEQTMTTPDHQALYLKRCAERDLRPRDERGFTSREADINDLAERLLVAAWGSDAADGWDIPGSVGPVVRNCFHIAKLFIDERYRRRS